MPLFLRRRCGRTPGRVAQGLEAAARSYDAGMAELGRAAASPRARAGRLDGARRLATAQLDRTREQVVAAFAERAAAAGRARASNVEQLLGLAAQRLRKFGAAVR